MWFNYGNVNGFDFWNNSDAIKPEDREKMGSIHQERIVSTRVGKDQRRARRRVHLDRRQGQRHPQRDHALCLHASAGDARIIDRVDHAEGARQGRLQRRQGRRARHPRRALPGVSRRRRAASSPMPAAGRPRSTRRHHRSHRRLSHQRRQGRRQRSGARAASGAR